MPASYTTTRLIPADTDVDAVRADVLAELAAIDPYAAEGATAVVLPLQLVDETATVTIDDVEMPGPGAFLARLAEHFTVVEVLVELAPGRPLNPGTEALVTRPPRLPAA